METITMTDNPTDERLHRWDEREIHRLKISPRMLEELNEHGKTSSAGTGLFGPELLVIDCVRYDGEE